jgi:hypothetical protein
VKRTVCACVAAGVFACVNVAPLGADVKTQEKGHAKFEGVLSVSPSVAPDDVQVPAGFKQKP